MPTIKTIKIKKKGGGTRFQKVMVLASGKYKFVKNTLKGMARKTRAKGRPAFETDIKRSRKAGRFVSKSRKKTNKPKTSKRPMAKKGWKDKILSGPIKKAATGLGLATIAALVVGIVAPQFVPIAKPIAAYVGGGIPGIAAEIVVDHGLLNQITGLFGFGNGGMVAQQEVGGL